MVKKFSVWRFTDRQFERYDLTHLTERSKEIRINYKENRFGYLLALADMFGQAGREAPEIAGALPSALGIRLKDIGRHEDNERILTISFDYATFEKNSN